MSFAKRERADFSDRDVNEVQQRRLSLRQMQTRQTVWRNSNGNAKSTDAVTNGFVGLSISMEFDIQPEMVGAVIGKGGMTARAIRSRTGANVHVHSPTTDSPRTFVELRGRLDQIELAFDELRAVISSIDESFAKQMQASVRLKTKPETVGCLIGKQGQNIKLIEEETCARVRVVAHEEGAEFQCVHISGDINAVDYATHLVHESLERYDATRSKKQCPIPMTSHRIQKQQQQQMTMESKPVLMNSLSQTKDNSSAPPILIQAPAGGFAPHPTILVLQADGMYHPAQVVNGYDNNTNGSSSGLVPEHPQSLMTSLTLQPAYQWTSNGLIPQIRTATTTTNSQIPQLSVAIGNQEPTVVAENYTQQFQPIQVSDYAITRDVVSQAKPELNNLPTMLAMGASMGFNLNSDSNQVPVSMMINNLPPQPSSLQ